jgi:hypothetical protein
VPKEAIVPGESRNSVQAGSLVDGNPTAVVKNLFGGGGNANRVANPDAQSIVASIFGGIGGNKNIAKNLANLASMVDKTGGGTGV